MSKIINCILSRVYVGKFETSNRYSSKISTIIHIPTSFMQCILYITWLDLSGSSSVKIKTHQFCNVGHYFLLPKKQIAYIYIYYSVGFQTYIIGKANDFNEHYDSCILLLNLKYIYLRSVISFITCTIVVMFGYTHKSSTQR